MSDINRIALFGKLNPFLYRSIESATVFCKLRGNPYVELAHWLNQILQYQDSDLHRIAQHFGLNAASLAADVTAALDRLPRGATSISDLSEHIEHAVERAWVYATLMFGDTQIRSAHVMVGLQKTASLRHVLFGISGEFRKIGIDALCERMADIVEASPESAMQPGERGAAATDADGAMPPAEMGRQEAIRRFTADLTERARKGDIDPVTGRDEEIRQVIDILMRRRQNNPILTGEAGVGKTAVVEGFALRLARGDVPPPLKDVALHMLDVGLLQAGASMKGEFENRLRQLIEEVRASAKPIVLFIDEAHTLVGAGGSAGTGDAANLLKPALARGDLRTIGATTWAEYKKYIEKDPALTRRFQVVQVSEPDEHKAILMLRGVAATLERHHRVLLLDTAIDAAVRLSHRYLPARQLPDKAVSLLDTSCARVAISQHATPPRIENCMRRIDALRIELEIIDREQAIGIDAHDRRQRARDALAREERQCEELDAQWKEEKALIEEIVGLRGRLCARDDEHADAHSDREALLASLRQAQERLAAIQGESPLISSAVDEQAVASVIADWTGIPVGRMMKNDIDAVLQLADTLSGRVIGQRHGLEMIARRIETSRARLDNPDKPIGVFMLCGPSGVGKTETALALAETLYGGEQNLITINMSEFQEPHTVSTLKGAPPGYVGYGEGGVLTEAVRRRPYSVVLLDEVEKAHPDVHEIFFQVFDKGGMEDGEGRYIDFRNTIIILTSNVGTDRLTAMCNGAEPPPGPEALANALRGPLLGVFPPALLGRMTVIPYYPLSDAMLREIVNLQLARIVARIADNHGIALTYAEEVAGLIVSRCTETESGGRMIDAILTNTVLPRISRAYLEGISAQRPLTAIHLSVADGEFEYAFSQ
jgi:type VI secretion system protein VasG